MKQLKPLEHVRLRGRLFTQCDIEIIKRIIGKNSTEGITYVSQVICQKLNWKQPSGWLKDRACREALRELEKLKLIVAFPQKSFNQKPNKKTKEKQADRLKFRIKRGIKYSNKIDKTPLTEIDFKSLGLKQVKGTKDEDFWNWLVNKYHYLGFKVFVGRSLKYLIYFNERVIAAIGFCDPVWAITPRDRLFKGYMKDQIRIKGVNNGRFLILPWVKVANLASHLLSVSIKNLYRDWDNYYLVRPEYVETFVNTNKFEGTCYKAANWKYVGRTIGYKRSGRQYMNGQASKAVYIYFLNKKLKKEFQNV
jgi:uncharacterized protein DUF4338